MGSLVVLCRSVSRVARLEVHWTGERSGEIAVALEGLGLEEAGGGRYFAEGEGRTLVRVVDAVRALESRMRSDGNDGFTVHFEDPGSAAV